MLTEALYLCHRIHASFKSFSLGPRGDQSKQKNHSAFPSLKAEISDPSARGVICETVCFWGALDTYSDRRFPVRGKRRFRLRFLFLCPPPRLFPPFLQRLPIPPGARAAKVAHGRSRSKPCSCLKCGPSEISSGLVPPCRIAVSVSLHTSGSFAQPKTI